MMIFRVISKAKIGDKKNCINVFFLFFPEEVREAVAASMPVVEFDRAPHDDSFNKIQRLLGRRKFSAIVRVPMN
jgi:hypothetical protein